MINRMFVLLCGFVVVAFTGCKRQPDVKGLNSLLDNPLPGCNHQLTQVIISDIFTPPVISRIYAYANIAAYEALRPAYPGMPSYAGRLKGLTAAPGAVAGASYDFRIAAIVAFTTAAQKLVFNGNAVKQIEDDYISRLDSLNIDKWILDSSVSYGRAVGNHIVAWSAADQYLQRNSLPAYIVTTDPGRWQPTPPGYSDAIETNWKTLRPLTLDSCSQFRPAPPIRFDTAANSACYREAYAVYDAVKHPRAADSAIAMYWDDNPNTSVTDGHITYFQQKNSPAGHWIYIACSVAQKEHLNAMQTASLLSKTAIALYDAFISCWDAKYTYPYLRPETFINRYIDKDWSPVLQTPPFPEYSSGHSVASASAATVLTRMIGANYSFTDSAEKAFGRPERRFSSFYEASDEASMSRFYGGIHFMNALTTGREEGRKVGNHAIDKLK